MSNEAQIKRRRYQLLRDVAGLKKGDIHPGEPFDVMQSSPVASREGEFLAGAWIRVFAGSPERPAEVRSRDVAEVSESP